MAAELRRVRLGDVADVGWGDTSTTKASYVPAGIQAYSATGPDGYLPEAQFDRTGVVVSAIGAQAGKTWLARGRWSTIKNTIRFWATDPQVDTEYLYWLTRNPDFWPKRGSAQPFISQGDARNLIVSLPPLDEQRRTAHILGTLDDKIELNRRMNETLEEMSRALFKSWFVDFDPVRVKAEGRDPGLPKHLADLFPDRLVDSELGEIPDGWSVRRVEDIAEKVAMGPFGSNIKVETFGTHGVPVISGQHLRGITLEDSSFNFVTAEHAERLAGANVQRGDIVFTHAGSIGQAAYIPESSRYERYVISQRQFYMRCDPAVVTPEFVALYFNSREGRHRLLANTSSSGVPSIARPVSYLRTIPITVPPLPVLRSFNEIARPILGAQEARKGANRTLAHLRDRLLRELVGDTGGTHD